MKLWVSPKGVVHKCNPLKIEAHLEKAKELYPDSPNPERACEDAGYVKTLDPPLRGTALLAMGSITSKQFDALTRIALFSDNNSNWATCLLKNLREVRIN